MADPIPIPDDPIASSKLLANHLDTKTTITEIPQVDNSDSRSSSLSDYDEGYEDNENDIDIHAMRSGTQNDEVDSEAETERLDITPQLPTRIQNDVSISHNERIKTPSKSQYSYDAAEVQEQEQDSTSSSLSHEPIAMENGMTDPNDVARTPHSLSRSDALRQSQSALAGRKRKRKSENDQTPDVESETENTAENRANSGLGEVVPEETNVEIEEQAEDELSEEDLKDLDMTTGAEKNSDKEAPLRMSLEKDNEPEAPRKVTKSKKGKRKSKRVAESALDETLVSQEERGALVDQAMEGGEELSLEGEGEEAEAATRNEEERKSTLFAR